MVPLLEYSDEFSDESVMYLSPKFRGDVLYIDGFDIFGINEGMHLICKTIFRGSYVSAI